MEQGWGLSMVLTFIGRIGPYDPYGQLEPLQSQKADAFIMPRRYHQYRIGETGWHNRPLEFSDFAGFLDGVF